MFRDVLDFFLGNGDVTQIKRILQETTMAADGVVAGAGAVSLQSIIKALALVIIVFFFFIDIYEHVQDEEYTSESIVRSFVKLFVSYLLVNMTFDVFHYAIQFSYLLLDKISTTAVGQNDITPGLNAVHHYFNSKSSVDVVFFLPIIFKLLIPYLILWVSRAIIYGTAIMRAIELVGRAILAPFAVANTFGDGGYIGGLRYLKKYLAIMLQSIAIVIIMWGTGMVVSTERVSNDDMHNTITMMSNYEKAEADAMSEIDTKTVLLESLKKPPLQSMINVFKDIKNILSGKNESAIKTDLAKGIVGQHVFNTVMGQDFIFMMFLCTVQAAATMLCMRSQRLINDALGV